MMPVERQKLRANKKTVKKGTVMPYVNIKVTKEGVTTDQKTALIKGVTDLLVKTLGKDPATTVVVIDEIDTDNWGIGGEPVTERRRR
jgi:4-oxalocrotonate tautomerase